MAKSERILKAIEERGGLAARNSEIIIDLEDFFEGNEWDPSIGCNLPDDLAPGISAFYAVLRSIKSKHNVQDVLVRIYSFDPEDEWPHSDKIYILTSANRQDVVSWTSRLYPSDVYDAFEEWTSDLKQTAKKLPVLQQGMKPFGVWWD